MALRIPQSEPLTVADIADPPDDGHRYELIDGCLIVTPSPARKHQRASWNLSVLLDAAMPAELEAVSAPYDWIVDDHTKLQPDILVYRRDGVDANAGALRVPPVLAVEILSPSTRRLDLGTKKLDSGRRRSALLGRRPVDAVDHRLRPRRRRVSRSWRRDW